MTPLNNRLKLALINRQKQGNLLQKGFTLVELMIVIVIVGILSAVALPNFLNQTTKAKGTECTSKATGLLKQVAAEALYTVTDADALGTSLATIETANSALCTFTYTDINADDIALVDADGKGDLATKYDAIGCVHTQSTVQKVDIDTTDGSVAAAATAPDCLTP